MVWFMVLIVQFTKMFHIINLEKIPYKHQSFSITIFHQTYDLTELHINYHKFTHSVGLPWTFLEFLRVSWTAGDQTS